MTKEQIGEIVIDGVARPIEIDTSAGRLEVRAGDHVSVIVIRLRGSVLSFIHTEVPDALRGQHIGDAMARAGLDYARAHGLSVMPFCPFVAAFIRRHSEYQDLVNPEFSRGE